MRAMRVSVTEATAQLSELVRRAEAGDEVILTEGGQTAVRLVPVRAPGSAAERRELLLAIREAASARASDGPNAAHSQDFLYDADGLPA